MSIDKDKNLIDETTDIVTEDAEIKKMFDEEFDMADIFVSEDLIAKTMTAIRGLSGDDTKNDEGTENVPSKVTNIAEFTKANTKTDTETSKTTEVTPVKKSSVIKWISGIAAALFIGIVGFTFIKLGLNSSVKNDSSNMASSTANGGGDIYAATESADPRIAAGKNYSSSNQPRQETSASIPMESSDNGGAAYYDPTLSVDSNAYITDMSEAKGDGSWDDEDIINHEKQSATSTDEIPSVVLPGTVEHLGGSEGSDSTYYKELETVELKEYIAVESEFILKNIANYRSLAKTDKVAMIRGTEEYKTIISLDADTESVIYNLLSGSEGDPELDYIYAVLLEDISGKTFTDDTWSTGKEYLELYNAGLENADQ